MVRIGAIDVDWVTSIGKLTILESMIQNPVSTCLSTFTIECNKLTQLGDRSVTRPNTSVPFCAIYQNFRPVTTSNIIRPSRRWHYNVISSSTVGRYNGKLNGVCSSVPYGITQIVIRVKIARVVSQILFQTGHVVHSGIDFFERNFTMASGRYCHISKPSSLSGKWTNVLSLTHRHLNYLVVNEKVHTPIGIVLVNE
ncbi:hypothetical protein PGUG_03592 [Meyerozyma guilliermondii ATCC 6260]|uniref:Uncharacterized protein n=1 Tax=Meyerozyma guilliermondii (strain ATCC 6260 / CBS 566 / DSM 6381 / JCM 1539 / NBRC 10279 / NRRL Y-324) TaxID=294746 RepID=A5DJZ1_PICGU|nr:uncharacterized protein PGUG_03592 [Meyerozyma guilliermondii ATCC 6260]EDK39495.2 hypothetical protein PGUG_03592 [Meyerozyma guilliermondii ATCC 6260]